MEQGMAMDAVQATTQEVWAWLAEVADPEIPVVSVVDLGIARDVHYEGDTVVVAMTPTYSGCPATALIRQFIEEKLRLRGVEHYRVDVQLSPAWTTDWMTDAARRKLRDFGIAPPVDGTAPTGLPTSRAAQLMGRSSPTVACPRCNSTHTEKVSQFGSTPCKASFRCKDCLEPFEYFKCI